jgi:hypothetical protein
MSCRMENDWAAIGGCGRRLAVERRLGDEGLTRGPSKRTRGHESREFAAVRTRNASSPHGFCALQGGTAFRTRTTHPFALETPFACEPPHARSAGRAGPSTEVHGPVSTHKLRGSCIPTVRAGRRTGTVASGRNPNRYGIRPPASDNRTRRCRRTARVTRRARQTDSRRPSDTARSRTGPCSTFPASRRPQTRTGNLDPPRIRVGTAQRKANAP